MKANIVFDLDGTLIDSAPDIQGIANQLLRARDLPPIDLATATGFIGQGAPVFIEKLRAARGIPDSEQSAMLKDFVARYDDAVSLTRPYPGVEEALVRLAADHALGLCTNKPHRPCLAVIRHFGLDRFFPTVIGGDSLPVRKPDPLPLLAAFDQMGPGPRIYVGDSETDAETARRAGVPFLLFTRGYRKAAVEDLPHVAAFDDFRALPDMLADVLSRLPA
ncbi:MAG: phosphoglycolate phosphatase [Rhodobacteraceae bacterium]|nr:MAG: phosphoglycolate phosphatase [Paracoccaceae bacterium]